jgi:hypothetical protein
MRFGAAAALLLAASAALLATGCGGEREFAAGEFIDAANAEGAALALGAEISTTENDEPIYAIRSRPEPGADPNPQLGEGPGNGTLIVAVDAAAAGAEFDRCETSADLTCFRAANVVLRFEAMTAADRARISGAVSALAADG